MEKKEGSAWAKVKGMNTRGAKLRRRRGTRAKSRSSTTGVFEDGGASYPQRIRQVELCFKKSRAELSTCSLFLRQEVFIAICSRTESCEAKTQNLQARAFHRQNDRQA